MSGDRFGNAEKKCEREKFWLRSKCTLNVRIQHFEHQNVFNANKPVSFHNTQKKDETEFLSIVIHMIRMLAYLLYNLTFNLVQMSIITQFSYHKRHFSERNTVSLK